MEDRLTPRAAALLLALGAVFFMITATTFASLGVILPAMIAEFRWSWATAGLGFTMLALLTGVFSPIAAASLERLGARLHYSAGGGVILTGFLLLSGANGVAAYLIATSLIGAGFALLANVPGAYLVARATPLKWRNVAIGAYLSAGGAGGVLGPLMANAHLAAGGDWRDYWRASAFAIAAIVATVVVLVQRRFAEGPGVARMGASDPQSNGSAWTARTAMKTPAFITISAALTVAYFCGVTVSTWSVAHLQNAGLAPTFAVAMFSLYSGLNAGARAVGGVIVRRVAAKRLLVAALLANVIGMSALAFAHTPGVAIIFAVFDGFAFGMALFATTAIIIDYFGLKNSPSLLGAANLAATVAMLGPMIAGETADRWGGFAPIFMIYAAAALAAALAVGAMRDPNEASAS